MLLNLPDLNSDDLDSVDDLVAFSYFVMLECTSTASFTISEQ